MFSGSALIAHGKDGLFVAPSDALAMEDAAWRRRRNSDMAEALTQAVRFKGEAWVWEEILPKWEAPIIGLLGQQGAAPLCCVMAHGT